MKGLMGLFVLVVVGFGAYSIAKDGGYLSFEKEKYSQEHSDIAAEFAFDTFFQMVFNDNALPDGEEFYGPKYDIVGFAGKGSHEDFMHGKGREKVRALKLVPHCYGIRKTQEVIFPEKRNFRLEESEQGKYVGFVEFWFFVGYWDPVSEFYVGDDLEVKVLMTEAGEPSLLSVFNIADIARVDDIVHDRDRSSQGFGGRNTTGGASGRKAVRVSAEKFCMRSALAVKGGRGFKPSFERSLAKAEARWGLVEKPIPAQENDRKPYDLLWRMVPEGSVYEKKDIWLSRT